MRRKRSRGGCLEDTDHTNAVKSIKANERA